MKKISTLSLLLGAMIMLSHAQIPGLCDELIFSEYVEGSGKNKAVEIYNPNGFSIDLSIYSIKVFKNNPNNPDVLQLSGVLPSNSVYVCGYDQADSALIALCDITSSVLGFDGNNAVGLYKNDTLIDLIGEIGITPTGNNGWQVGIGSTKDYTLVRGLDIFQPSPYWATNQVGYDVFPMDDFSHLGVHESNCSNLDTISWFREGTEIVWSKQKDVFTFRLVNGQQFTGTVDPAVIENVIYDPNSARQLNEVRFTQSSTTTQREFAKLAIRQDPAFEREMQVVTKDPSADNSQERFVNLNDLVIVIFKDPFITPTEVDQFRISHNVSLHREPPSDLPAYAHGYYAFRREPSDTRTISDIAKTMWKANSAILLAAEPYMQVRLQPHLTCPINDTYYNFNTQSFLWHINNNGTLFNSTGSKTSTNGADPDICGCWGAGYVGTGVKIAVIDFHGFEWTHEDMGGQFIDGWNTIDSTAYTSSTPLPPFVSGQYHGTTMSGTMAALVNNGKGVAGVAPGAKIIPILISTSDLTTLLDALEKALSLDADVVNMSFGYTPEWSPPKFLIQDLLTLGRAGPNDTLGTTCVTSAGNDDLNTDQWPAAWDSSEAGLISVIGSNPNDFRHSGTDEWGVGPSNYGFSYSVAAPGAFITSLSFMGKGNPSLGSNYTNSGGTSFSSAIVSGVSAILLNKNTFLTAQEVETAIENNTDKVNAGTYDYNVDPVNHPGQSIEMGFGRVNCLQTINSVIANISEHSIKPDVFSITNPVTDRLIIRYKLKDSGKQYYVKIFDVLSRELYKGSLSSSNTNESIDVKHLQDGVYVIVFYDRDGNGIQTGKFIKN